MSCDIIFYVSKLFPIEGMNFKKHSLQKTLIVSRNLHLLARD